MQPPFKQPLQAKGQPEVEKSNHNDPPVLNSPTKAGHPGHPDVRSASQSRIQEMIALPVAEVEAPNMSYLPSQSEPRLPPNGSTSFISEQREHPLHSVYGSPIKSMSRPNPGRWYGISGFPISDRMVPLPSVSRATTSTPISHYTPTLRQYKQRDFGSQPLTPQQAQLSRPTPQVPVTKQLFVSVPSAPLSCPPSSPLTRATAPAKGDPSSPGKRTVFFKFGEGIDDRQISQIIKKMAEAAERHTGDTCEVIPTIKLQDPPLSKIKRRRSSESDNISSSDNSSKASSPIKSKCLDASASISKESLQVVNKTLEDTKRSEGLKLSVPNSQFVKHIRDSPCPEKYLVSDSPVERPASLNWSKVKETMPSRHSSSVSRLSPHIRCKLRYPDLEVPREHERESMITLKENNQGAQNDCVSIILNESRKPTAINFPRTVDSLGNFTRKDDPALLPRKEKVCRQGHQNRMGNFSSCKTPLGSQNNEGLSIFQEEQKALPHGCDEVDGMDTPMDFDDNYYNYDQTYNRSPFTTQLGQVPNLHSEYQGMHGSALTSQGFIANSARDDLSFKRQSDRWQTSYGYKTTPIRSQTSTLAGHPSSYGSRRQTLNPMVNDRSRDHHLESNGQSFTQDRSFISKELHSFTNTDIPSSPYTRSFNHSHQDRTLSKTLHTDFSRGHSQISSAESRVPYKTDHKGRVVVEPEQVEDTSTDVVNIFGSDDDSPNNSFWPANQCSRTKDFNNNNGSIIPDSCHVVTTHADTNVHFINPMELSDSSSMSCEDRSDHSNTSLLQEDCVPESKFSRLYYHDETDGCSAAKIEQEAIQKRSYGKGANLPPTAEYNSLSQASLSMTSGKGLHSSADDILSNNWPKTHMAYKSRSQESILSDKIDVTASGPGFAEHTEKKYDSTPKSHSHQSFISRQWQQDQIVDPDKCFSNSISKIKTFEDLSAIQSKTLTDPKRGYKKLHPEKRAGFIRIKEARRKQKVRGYENRKSWSSSLPRRQTNNHHSSQKKKNYSRSLDDLLQQNRYQESQYESDDDEFDEVDGLGDDDKQKSRSTNSLERLRKPERNNKDNRDNESDVVHCFDEPDDVPPQKESDIVSCFDENFDKPGQNNLLSAVGQDLINKNKGSVVQINDEGNNKDHDVVHCMSGDDINGTITNAASSQQENVCVPSSSVYKRSKDRFQMEDKPFESKGQNYKQVTNIIPEHFHETAMTPGKLPSFYNHSTIIEKRLQTPSKSTLDADVRILEKFGDEKSRECYRQILMSPGDQWISTSSPLIHEPLDNTNPHFVQRSCSLDNGHSSLHHVNVDRLFDVQKGISSEQAKIQEHSKDNVCRSIQFDHELRNENEHKIEQAQLKTMASSDIDMDMTVLSDPSLNDREIVKNQTPSVSHSLEQYKHRGVMACKVQTVRKEPKFYRPWLSSPLRADNNDEKSVPRKTLKSGPITRLLREAELSPMPHIFSRSQSDVDERQTTTGLQRFGQDLDSSTLPFSEASSEQQQHRLDVPVSSADMQHDTLPIQVALKSSKEQIKEAKWDTGKPEYCYPLPSTNISLIGKAPKGRTTSDMTLHTSNLQNQRNHDAELFFTESDNQKQHSITSNPHIFDTHSLRKKTSSNLSQHSSVSPLKSFGLRSRDIRGLECSRSPKSNVIKSTKRSAVTKLDFEQTTIFAQPSASNLGGPEYACQGQECSKAQLEMNRPCKQSDVNTASVVTSAMSMSQFNLDAIAGRTENSDSGPGSSNFGKQPDREKDEIDIRIEVTDVMKETRSLGQRLEEIYQSNRGECECARVEQEVLQTALDMFGKLCAAPETQANFSQELRKTNKVITDALEVAQSLRQLCRHGRKVSEVLPGSVILRLKCKTLMAVLDLCRMYKDGELHALLFVILGMRKRKLAPGLTLRISIDETNVKTCLVSLRGKVSFLMGLPTPKSRSPKKKSPAKRVVKSTENLLSSPSSPLSPRSVHERWSSTPVLPTKSPLTSPMYGNSPSFPVYRRERKFSFGDSTRSAFQELNLSDTDSPFSSLKEELLRPDFLFRRIRSPCLISSPPSTSPLTPPIRLKRCEVIQEQENIVHPYDDDGWLV